MYTACTKNLPAGILKSYSLLFCPCCCCCCSRMAVISLQNIMANFPELRHEVLKGMAIFILREIPDSCPLVLESALKTLGQFIPFWRSQLTPINNETLEVADEPLLLALSWVEACALVTFCSYRSVARKFSLAIMKEVRLLTSMLGISRVSCWFFPLHFSLLLSLFQCSLCPSTFLLPSGYGRFSDRCDRRGYSRHTEVLLGVADTQGKGKTSLYFCTYY